MTPTSTNKSGMNETQIGGSKGMIPKILLCTKVEGLSEITAIVSVEMGGVYWPRLAVRQSDVTGEVGLGRLNHDTDGFTISGGPFSDSVLQQLSDGDAKVGTRLRFSFHAAERIRSNVNCNIGFVRVWIDSKEVPPIDVWRTGRGNLEYHSGEIRDKIGDHYIHFDEAMAAHIEGRLSRYRIVPANYCGNSEHRLNRLKAGFDERDNRAQRRIPSVQSYSENRRLEAEILRIVS